MPDKTRADLCIDAVNAAIDHAVNFAQDAPLERFLAQEIAGAKAEAYAEAGWDTAAKHWEAAIARLGEMDITSRLALAKARGESE